MIWQHDSSGAQFYFLGLISQMRDQYFGRRASQTGSIMVFRNPETMITQFFGKLSQFGSFLNGLARRTTFADRRLVQDTKFYMLHFYFRFWQGSSIKN